MTRFTDFVSPAANTEPAAEDLVSEAVACLDRFTLAFNACDTAAMDAQLHFPHVMFSGADCLIWPTAGQHPADFFDELRKTGWDHTQYERQEPVLVSRDKVHFVVAYSRRDEQSQVLSLHTNLWIVTRVAGRWGVAVRSY